MSDQAPRPRNRGWTTPTAMLTLAALAAAAALADLAPQPNRWSPAAITLGGTAVVVAVWELRRGPTGRTTPAEIEPSRAAAVRAERERADEAAAVRMLRAKQPELSLRGCRSVGSQPLTGGLAWEGSQSQIQIEVVLG